MFERFTEGARRVILLAREEARILEHDYIGADHILLGLVREEEGAAARVLASLGISAERVRVQVARTVGSGEGVRSGQLWLTPAATRVLELALREALSLGHAYIGTEHILLGLVCETEGVAARILLHPDGGAEKIRDEVTRVLSCPDGPRDASDAQDVTERAGAPSTAHTTSEQRRQALRRANEVRARRALLKRDLREGGSSG